MIVDYIESYRDRFGVEPICTVLSEHGCPIAPSTYYERRRQPVTEAELEDAYLANALVNAWSRCGVRTGASTGLANSGRPPATPGSRWAGTRSPG